MIISRTPIRIPLGGGGTDLPAYYEKHEAFLLTAAVNRYVYILVKSHFENTFRFTGYHKKEVTESPDQILHPVVQEVLKLLKIEPGVEIVSVADVPANSGLGTSSSFTVGLLNALHAYKNEHLTPNELAREALLVERVFLKEPGGVQDQYIAAHGGLISMDISKKGEVAVNPLKMDLRLVSELEDHLFYFYTHMKRTASEIQGSHVESLQKEDETVIQSLHEIKQIGLETKKALEEGDLPRFGGLLNKHWHIKRRVSGNISNGKIDRWYQLAIEAGATGGKLLGAGGGGFLMFYCEHPCKERVRMALTKEKLQEIRLQFEPTGSRIILNL